MEARLHDENKRFIRRWIIDMLNKNRKEYWITLEAGNWLIMITIYHPMMVYHI